MLHFNVFISFCWMWASAPTATLLKTDEYVYCSQVALEEEPYILEYRNAESRGTYIWSYTAVSESKEVEIKVLTLSENNPLLNNSRVSASLFENDSHSQTYVRTRIMFRPVKADERDTLVRCINHFNYHPFKSEVFSCRMRVHAKPQLSQCLVLETPPSNFSVRCSAQQVFPDIVCTVDLTEASLKSKPKNTAITYSSITYYRGDAEYKNASCVAEFQNLPPGAYSAAVSVNVQSIGPSGKNFVTKGYQESFNFTVPKPSVSLTQTSVYRCLDHNKSTLAVHLKCEAEGYTQKPRVDWYWNDIKVEVANALVRWSNEKVSSTFKFQPVPGDTGAIINCTVYGDTKAASAVFRIPEYPNLPPEFTNASGGQLLLNPGSNEITCRIPGNGSGFVKLNITCSANDTRLIYQVSPGSVGHLTVKNALVLDLSLCRCSAVHNFFCYSLFAEVLVKVKTYANTTYANTPQEHTTKFQTFVMYIACSVIFFLIVGVLLLIAYKRWIKRRGESTSQQSHHSHQEHIYEDPVYNIAPGSLNLLDPNAAEQPLLFMPPGRPTHIVRDRLGYLEPKSTTSFLPDVVSGFNRSEFSQQRARGSVSRRLSKDSSGPGLCEDHTAVKVPLLGSYYINIADIGSPSGDIHDSGNRNRETMAPTPKPGVRSCNPVEVTFRYNEMYISPLDTNSSSTTSLPFEADTLQDYKSLTMNAYKTLIESSNFGISKNEPNSLHLENPKSHKFFSKPLEKQTTKKENYVQSDTFIDTESQCCVNRKLNGAIKSC